MSAVASGIVFHNSFPEQIKVHFKTQELVLVSVAACVKTPAFPQI